MVLGTLSSVAASQRAVPAKKPIRKANGHKEPVRPNFFEKYIDMGDLIISMGRLYKNKKRDTASISIACLEALSIEELPITLKSGRETIIGEFFDGDKLKEGLKFFLTKWFAGALKRRHIAETLESIQASLKLEAVQSELDEDWINVDESLKTLIAYFDGDEGGSIEDAIDLEEIPFFGAIIRDYILTDKLIEALDKALKGEKLTKSVLLDCLDIEQIAERNGYEEVPNANGIREAIELFFSMMEDDKDAMYKVFDILGNYRETKQTEEEDDDRPARRRLPSNGRPRVIADQEDADAAYARSLADEDDERPARVRPGASTQRRVPAASSSTARQRPVAPQARPAASATRRVPATPARPAAPVRQQGSSRAVIARQEAADAALARRLQEEWNSEEEN